MPSAGCAHWLGACRPPYYGKAWQGPTEGAPDKAKVQIAARWCLQTRGRRCCCSPCRGCPPVPSSHQEDAGHTLLSQRDVSSPTTQDHQARATLCTPSVPALPPQRQQELGAGRDHVSRGPVAEPRDQGGIPAPGPHAMAEMHFTLTI